MLKVVNVRVLCLVSCFGSVYAARPSPFILELAHLKEESLTLWVPLETEVLKVAALLEQQRAARTAKQIVADRLRVAVLETSPYACLILQPLSPFQSRSW